MYNENKKKYNFITADSDKYRTNHGRVFKNKMTNDEGRRTKKIKPDAKGKKIIWKEK